MSGIKYQIGSETHKDVQELWEAGIDVEDLKKGGSFLTDPNGNRFRYFSSYHNPVGVEVLVLKTF